MTPRKTEYWFVVCDCREAFPLAIATEPEIPDVEEFSIICTHQHPPPRAVVQQVFHRADIRRGAWDEPIPNFQPHPQFQ
jgi:hypothetical protein